MITNGTDSDFTPPSERLPDPLVLKSKLLPKELPIDFLIQSAQSPNTKVQSWIKTLKIYPKASVLLKEKENHAISPKVFQIRTDVGGRKVAEPPTLSEAHLQALKPPDESQHVNIRSSIMIRETFSKEKPETPRENGKMPGPPPSSPPENSRMREFYSYLKINTNPSASKTSEDCHQQRRSKRVQRQALAANESNSTVVTVTDANAELQSRLNACSGESKKPRLKVFLQYKGKKKADDIKRKRSVSEDADLRLAPLLFYQSALALRDEEAAKITDFEDAMNSYVAVEKLTVPNRKSVALNRLPAFEKENVACNGALLPKVVTKSTGAVPKLQKNKQLNGSLKKLVVAEESRFSRHKENGISSDTKLRLKHRINGRKTYKKHAVSKHFLLKYTQQRALRSTSKIGNGMMMRNKKALRNNNVIKKTPAPKRIIKPAKQVKHPKDKQQEEKPQKQSQKVVLETPPRKESKANGEITDVESLNSSPLKIVSASAFTKFEEIELPQITVARGSDIDSDNKSSLHSSPIKLSKSSSNTFATMETLVSVGTRDAISHALSLIVSEIRTAPQSSPESRNEALAESVITISSATEEEEEESIEVFTVNPYQDSPAKEDMQSCTSSIPKSLTEKLTKDAESVKSSEVTDWRTASEAMETSSTVSEAKTANADPSLQEHEVVNFAEIASDLKRSKYVPLPENMEPKSLHKSLVQTKRPEISAQEQAEALNSTQELFNGMESTTSEESCAVSPLKILNRKKAKLLAGTTLSPHSIHLSSEEYGAVLYVTYLDHHLILAQERAVRFWNRSSLGHVLAAQDMWVPRGKIQRLNLGAGCTNRMSKEMATCCDDSIALLELWTKEHKSEKREQTIADVFVTVYFNRRESGKKVLQLENMQGSVESVQYVVIKHSRTVVVSWRLIKVDTCKTVVKSYTIDEDFQTVKCIKEMTSVENNVVSLHNIEKCDTLVMGAGDNNINIWNLEFGFLVATVQLQKLSYQPVILWTKCDRGYLYVVQQFSGSLLQLVAINGLNYNWKSLQTYRPPLQQDQSFRGVAIHSGAVVGFYDSDLFCWNMRTGQLVLSEKLQPDFTYIPKNKHVILINEEQVQVKHIFSHIVSD